MFEDMKLNQLQSLFIRANHVYHNGGESPLSDDQFDELKRRIRAVTPEWGPLKQVGAPVITQNPLAKSEHKIHMGSIANSMDAIEFTKWFEKMGGWATYATLKIDGLSVDLEYVNGELQKAITRGDGVVGENVTHHLLAMDIPLKIPVPLTFNVRGEVVMLQSQWNNYKAVHPEAKNPRNVAAGMLGRKTSQTSHLLKFIAHRLHIDSPRMESYEDAMDWLKMNGFTTPIGRVCPDLATCVGFHAEITHQREAGALPYEIDGVVFTINSEWQYNELGIDGESCPRGSVAWKFKAQAAVSTINNIELQVGHTGAITPVAILQPVVIGGVTVSRASLANFDEINRLKIHLGARVEVTRQGDVIPKVIRVVQENLGSLLYQSPKQCPVCQGATGKKKGIKGDSAVLYCLNSDECSAQTTGRINKWVKDTEMMDVGTKVVQAMVEQDLVTGPADLYRLTLPGLIGMSFGKSEYGERRAEKVIKSINSRKRLSLETFLGALGVQGLGAGVVANVRKALPGEFDKLSDWLNSTKLIDFAEKVSLPNTGRTIWERLQQRRAIAEDLLRVGVEIVAPEAESDASMASGPLTGKVFCLTGDFPQKKKIYHEKIIGLGGKVEDDVRGHVTHVIIHLIPDDPTELTGKGKKAHAKGILFDLAHLENLLSGASVPESVNA